MNRRTFLATLAASAHAAPKGPVQLLDDGGWCWFEDERALILGNKLIFGTVATGWRDASIAGQIRCTQYDLKNGNTTTFVLHDPKGDENPRQWVDDHNSPAFVRRPDGRILTLYSRHGPRNEIHYRISERSGDAAMWRDEGIFVPSAKSRVTYSNPFYLKREKRIYDFYRGYENSFKPSYIWSEDQGVSWKPGGVYINVPSQFRHRPYVKYCSDGESTVHMAYTEGHPRDFDNSVYHVYYRDGKLHRSEGTVIRSLQEGLQSPDEGTRIFQGAPDAVAWTTDFHVTPKGELLLLFTVQKDGAGKKSREGGMDHRFHLARLDGTSWTSSEVAHAGSRLYPGEDDYTGLGAIDPYDPDLLVISTNADPASGTPLPHRELFRGRRGSGNQYSWTPITQKSDADNVRPIIPIWKGRNRAILWLQGTMRAYTDYDFSVMALFERR